MHGSNFAANESSFLNTQLFVQYFEWFVRQIPPKRPVLVLMDGYKSHWSARTLEFARSHGIFLFSLPSHTSHFLQPLDVTVFFLFKRILDQELRDFFVQHKRHAILSDMVHVGSKSLARCFRREYVVGGVREDGGLASITRHHDGQDHWGQTKATAGDGPGVACSGDRIVSGLATSRTEH